MTDELKASYLTGLPVTPAALMIADTDESDSPYQSILGATTTMPTVTITRRTAKRSAKPCPQPTARTCT